LVAIVQESCSSYRWKCW